MVNYKIGDRIQYLFGELTVEYEIIGHRKSPYFNETAGGYIYPLYDNDLLIAKVINPDKLEHVKLSDVRPWSSRGQG